MLWVNGYSGELAQFLKLSPKTGRPYWGKNLYAAARILKDWNWMFIDPDIGFISTAALRFKAGFDFAQENERTIRNNILLSGNMLHIIAHGKGVAFAEGISAWLYEEKGIVTDLSIYIEGSNLGFTPQSRRAVDCRILYNPKQTLSKKDTLSLKFKDVVISENHLINSFCRYSISLVSRDAEHKTDHLYFKTPEHGKSGLNRHTYSKFGMWSSIDHAIKMYVDSEVEHFSSKTENVKYVVFEKFSMN